VVLVRRARDPPLERRALTPTDLVAGMTEDPAHVKARVPQLEVAQHGELPHRVPIRTHRSLGRPLLLCRRQPELAARDHEARREPLDVPLPRTARRLIEVVDVEHQLAIGRSEAAEVRQMRIAAQLHRDAGTRRRRQISRHQLGRTAKERERRRQHPAMTDRHQLRFSLRGLLQQDLDRRSPLARRLPLGVSAPRCPCARGLAVGRTLGHRRMRDAFRRTAARASKRWSDGGGHDRHATGLRAP
jgi:hypothetical protein